jgi:hypothetical protein
MDNTMKSQAQIAVPLKGDPKAVKKPAANLKYQRDKDRELVKGIFRYYEVPGGSMAFMYKAYKEDPVEKYDLLDGGVYTLPLGVAKHLNKNGKVPVHKYMVDENGKPVARVGEKISRFGFQSLEFVDVEELANAEPLIQVAEPI